MKNSQFNLLYEEVKRELITEGLFDKVKSYFKQTWSLEDEFKTILPFVVKRIKNEMASMYASNEPGMPDFLNESAIEKLDEGSSRPGFKVSYDLPQYYVEENLLPCLLKNPNTKFSKLNKKYNFDSRIDDLDSKVVIMLYTESDKDLDLGKPNVEIKKLSIKKWDGNLYLNFDIPDVDKDKSNINIGTIELNVKVTDYDSLSFRLLDWISTAGNR